MNSYATKSELCGINRLYIQSVTEQLAIKSTRGHSWQDAEEEEDPFYPVTHDNSHIHHHGNQRAVRSGGVATSGSQGRDHSRDFPYRRAESASAGTCDPSSVSSTPPHTPYSAPPAGRTENYHKTGTGILCQLILAAGDFPCATLPS